MKNSKLSSESFFNFTVLEKKPTYTLGKNERLKSRKAIDQLFTTGKSFSSFPFKVIYSKSNTGEQTTAEHQLKCAFSVSKKNFKKAVFRNRIKRLMREAYRLQKAELQAQLQQSSNCLSVFILYTSTDLPEYKAMLLKMDAVIKRLQKITSEEVNAHT
jgi:ribonuclease P protein component